MIGCSQYNVTGNGGGYTMRHKVKLVMKRLRDVKPGDVYVGRSGWRSVSSAREVLEVRPSFKKPGKMSLVYRLDGAAQNYGKVRRWPDFYVICLKDPCTCSSVDYCERCLLLMSKR